LKVITVYMHKHRTAAVVDALVASGIDRIALSAASGMLSALGDEGHSFSVELGAEVLREARLEIICEDHELAALVSLVRLNARTGQAVAGYIVVTDALEILVIDGTPGGGPQPERRLRS
jgi:nitrogen regulatory protein P-II 1